MSADQAPPLSPLAHRYLDALLVAQRHEARELVLGAAKSGVDIKDIYIDVFQATQRRIGWLWQTNQISVAQEHYCTAATQAIMSQVYPYVLGAERCGRSLVMACVAHELHEIGARMVADFFEMDGWDTYFLGANTPRDDVTRTIIERKPDILGISATMTAHLPAVRDLISETRSAPGFCSTKIIVGGYPLNSVPDLWRRTGADGWARDAVDAVQMANGLVVQATE